MDCVAVVVWFVAANVGAAKERLNTEVSAIFKNIDVMFLSWGKLYSLII